MVEATPSSVYFVCQHGEVAAWCGKCVGADGLPRKPDDEFITVKGLVSFYETLEAVKSLSPAVRRARTQARVAEERGRLLATFTEKQKKHAATLHKHKRTSVVLNSSTLKERIEKLVDAATPRTTLLVSPRTTGPMIIPAPFLTIDNALGSTLMPPRSPSSARSSTPAVRTDETTIYLEKDESGFPFSPSPKSGSVPEDFGSPGGRESPDEEEEKKETSKKTTVFIVRHGERIDHIDEKWIKMAKRPFDPGLSAKGLEQAREVGEKLKRDGEIIDYVYCSPFQRTLETASEIAKVLGLAILLEDGIAESVRVESVKKWEEKEGRKWPTLRLLSQEEIKGTFPLVEFTHTSVAPVSYPETEDQLYQRVVTVVNELPKRHEGQTILLVSHQSPVEYLAFELCAGNAQDKYVSYCCLSKAVKPPDAFAFSLEYQHDDSFLTHPERG